MNHITELMQSPDRDLLEAAFQEHQEALPGKTAQGFIEDIVRRVYKELLCSRAGRYVTSPDPHAGDAFRSWVDQEIHFVLEGTQVDEAKYVEVRQAIMNAVAARAAELFSSWKGKTYPEDKSDKRNLRASLRSYLPPHLQYEERPAEMPVGNAQPAVLEQKPDGTTVLRWQDEHTVMYAVGTPDSPLPELLLKDPKRAADLMFGTFLFPRSKVAAVATAEEPMPKIPENASYLEIKTADEVTAGNLIRLLMMNTGYITARNGSTVTLSISQEKFQKVWDFCQQHGIRSSMLSFR